MLMFFLEGVLEAIDHVNHVNHQAEGIGIHKCHAISTSANGWRSRVVNIDSSFLVTAIGTHTHPKNELVQVISLGLDFRG